MDGLTERDEKAQSEKSLVVIWTWTPPPLSKNEPLPIGPRCADTIRLLWHLIGSADLNSAPCLLPAQDIFRQRQEESLWDTLAQSATFGHHKMNRTLYQFSDDNTTANMDRKKEKSNQKN